MSATDGHKWLHLSVKQENAIDLLVIGKTDAAVAEAVGVDRVTVTNWRNHHPAFQGELNRRRQEVWGASVEQVRSLVPKAISVVANELERGNDPVRAAMQILKLAMAFGAGACHGLTDAEQIFAVRIDAKARAKGERRRQYRGEMDAVLDDADPKRVEREDESDRVSAERELMAELSERLGDDAV